MIKTSAVIAMTTLLALTGYMLYQDNGIESKVDYEAEFAKFNAKYRKNFVSLSDKSLRLEVFKANFDKIAAHNASPASYKLAINEYADLTYDEFQSFYLGDMSKSGFKKEHCEGMATKPFSVPDEVDWRAEGKVQKVKNQKACGSCWSFSAAGAIESAIAIKKGELPNVSEQELVDCSGDYGNYGCNGGLMAAAFEYVLDNNINSEDDYPYEAVQNECRTGEIGQGKIEINGCVRATPTVQGLVEALAIQPVAIAFHVQDDFRFYQSGVYTPKSCPGNPNHGVLAVGYSTQGSSPYYIVKNSWGVHWGDEGFFKISMGSGRGTCMIAGSGANFYPTA